MIDEEVVEENRQKLNLFDWNGDGKVTADDSRSALQRYLHSRCHNRWAANVDEAAGQLLALAHRARARAMHIISGEAASQLGLKNDADATAFARNELRMLLEARKTRSHITGTSNISTFRFADRPRRHVARQVFGRSVFEGVGSQLASFEGIEAEIEIEIVEVSTRALNEQHGTGANTQTGWELLDLEMLMYRALQVAFLINLM
jgi:hypothetical protein